MEQNKTEKEINSRHITKRYVSVAELRFKPSLNDCFGSD